MSLNSCEFSYDDNCAILNRAQDSGSSAVAPVKRLKRPWSDRTANSRRWG